MNNNKELKQAMHLWESHCLQVIGDLTKRLQVELLECYTGDNTVNIWVHIDRTQSALKGVFREVAEGNLSLDRNRWEHFHKCKLMMFLSESYWIDRGLAPPSFKYLMRLLEEF